jgi:hypothetical protein
MSAAFPPRPGHEQARDWLRRQLEWEALLAALRDARRVKHPASRRRQRESAAA